MSENKPRVLLRDFADEIANSYQESLKTEAGLKRAEKINKKRTGAAIGEVDKEGSASRHRDHVIGIMNKYLVALGVKEYSHYFKGGIGEDGKPIREDSYAFYIEDKELVKKILNTGRKGGYIQKGKFDKSNMETLRGIVENFEILFRKYCTDEKDLEDIIRTMHGVSKVDVRTGLSKIQEDIENYIMQIDFNPDFDELAEYLIGEEDYIQWLDKFKETMYIFIKLFRRYWDEIISYRKEEYETKERRLSLQELDELNDFIQQLGEKASKKGIVKEPRDILSENAVISGKKDIAGLKNRKELKECIMELKDHPGYQVYGKLFKKVSSEEMMREIFWSVDLEDFINKKREERRLIEKAVDISEEEERRMEEMFQRVLDLPQDEEEEWDEDMEKIERLFTNDIIVSGKYGK